MGQRHQAFLIAKVKPYGSAEARYRCIAAYHHQFSNGQLRRRAAHRLFTLARQPENAEVIREEIRALDGKYGEFGKEPHIPGKPCPFIATLLGAAWDLDLSMKTAYISGVTLENNILDADMSSWGGDNNDGITIIDISNPEDPAYCFLPRRHAPVVCDLKGGRPLPYAALCEAWPHEYASRTDEEDYVQPTPVQLEEIPAHVEVPSLVDISFRQTIRLSLESSDAIQLDELPMFFQKMHIVEDVLSKLSPPPAVASPLVLKFAEGKYRDHSLDLSGYSFTDAQILAAVTRLPELHSLNLSRNAEVTTKGIQDLLIKVPSLRRLVLINCPKISNNEVEALARSEPSMFLNIESLLHPAFNKIARYRSIAYVQPEEQLPAAISIFVDQRHYMEGVTLPFLNPRLVVSGLMDIATAKAQDTHFAFRMSAARVLQVAFAALPRGEGKSWAERTLAVPLPLNLNVLKAELGGWSLVLCGSWSDFFAFQYAFLRTHKVEKSESTPSVSSDIVETANSLEDPEEDADTESSPSATESDILETFESSDSASRIDDEDEQQPEGYPKKVRRRKYSPWELHDLRSFMDTTRREGYPEVPEETVNKLEALLEKAKLYIMEPKDVFSWMQGV